MSAVLRGWSRVGATRSTDSVVGARYEKPGPEQPAGRHERRAARASSISGREARPAESAELGRRSLSGGQVRAARKRSPPGCETGGGDGSRRRCLNGCEPGMASGLMWRRYRVPAAVWLGSEMDRCRCCKCSSTPGRAALAPAGRRRAGTAFGRPASQVETRATRRQRFHRRGTALEP